MKENESKSCYAVRCWQTVEAASVDFFKGPGVPCSLQCDAELLIAALPHAPTAKVIQVHVIVTRDGAIAWPVATRACGALTGYCA